MGQETSKDSLFWREKGRERQLEDRLREILLRSRDGWSRTFDNNFARDFFQSLSPSALPTQLIPVQCCTCCSSIVVAGCKIHLSKVSAAEKNCQLCALLLGTVKRHRNNELDVHIVEEQLTLKIGSEGPRILRLCADSEYSAHAGKDIQISLPILPEAKNYAHFALLRAWLRLCNKSHLDCNKHDTKSKTALPTRLLYIGHPDDQGYDPDILRLDTAPEKRGKYIALSHCWGKLPMQDKEQFCTTQDNINRRRGGFSVSELPKTFQDAIKVTRELRVPYLWIDSLCIIQFGDNGEDWERESRRMESVFSSAYCTIAATSAVDSKAGFLDRNVSTEYVYAQDASGRRFYVCTDIDDFDNDVENAPLNTRAWVMQERVLSRRTIHFSANQTYFECGAGVYCENLTRLASSFRKEFFMLDPNFPDRLLASGDRRTMEFIHFLSQDYSKRDLTKETDRCVAISGLEARIARAKGCKSRYGIFQEYLHRNLLWQASDNKMEPIKNETQRVPSWSWMAYKGGIQFMDIPFGTVDWISDLRFDKKGKHALIAGIWGFHNCSLKKEKKCHSILGLRKKKRGWIQYDIMGNGYLQAERCVVVGRIAYKDQHWLKKTKYYILVVRSTSTDGEYKRVGVGLVQSNYVVRHSPDVRVV